MGKVIKNYHMEQMYFFKLSIMSVILLHFAHISLFTSVIWNRRRQSECSNPYLQWPRVARKFNFSVQRGWIPAPNKLCRRHVTWAATYWPARSTRPIMRKSWRTGSPPRSRPRPRWLIKQTSLGDVTDAPAATPAPALNTSMTSEGGGKKKDSKKSKSSLFGKKKKGSSENKLDS